METVERMLEYFSICFNAFFEKFIRCKISMRKKIGKSLEIGGKKERVERSGRSGLIDRGGEDGRSNIP